MKESVVVGLTGLFFGFALSRIGFSSWDEVHRMFTFSDLRLLFTFMSAVVFLAVSWIVLARLTGAKWSPRNLHPGTLIGGALFGIGWALGGMPSIAMVQLGEGQLGAGITLIGIFAGNWLYSVVHERFFRWSAASCVDA